MVPPTRHSTRLGAAGLSAAQKEDENAGALLDRPVGRSLRGRKDSNANAKAVPTKAAATNGKAGLSTANVRKRILDDRTNNAKSNSNMTSTNNLKPNMAKNEIASRKVSGNAAAKKTITVLEELDEAVTKKAIRQPIKKEVKTRTLTRTASATSKVSEPSERAGPSTKSKTLSRANSTTAASTKPSSDVRLRATRARSSKPVVNTRRAQAKATVEEPYDAGHVTKKPRTSEPEEVEKENTASLITTTQDSKVDDPSKRRKSLRVLTDRSSRGLKPSKVVLKEGEEGWEDLDEGDEDDPLMVKEYVNEIYQYMRDLEWKTLPDSTYMSRQSELTWKMRGVLVDWIIEVHSKFRLLPETLYLAINLMDRFLTKRTVALIKFQLVGVTALFLAAKYEEVICPSVTNFLYMTDGGYDCEEILKAETYMLEMLDWDLRYPNPLNFLRRVSKADNYDIQSRTFAKYFMEISVVDHRLVAVQPSILAAASIWLARKLLDRGCWTANLIHYSGYTETDLLPTAQIMLDYILRSGCKTLGMGLEPAFVGAVDYEGGHEHGNLYKKYATRKFFRVSELVRDWAVGRYTFETPTGWEWDQLEEWSESSKERADREEVEVAMYGNVEEEEEEVRGGGMGGDNPSSDLWAELETKQ